MFYFKKNTFFKNNLLIGVFMSGKSGMYILSLIVIVIITGYIFFQYNLRSNVERSDNENRMRSQCFESCKYAENPLECSSKCLTKRF